MLDTLFHIPRQIGGWPVFGVGLLLAAWCVFGLVVVVVAWRRGAAGRELAGYVPLLAIVAAAVVWFLPRLCGDDGLPIHGYGVMLLIAVVSATSLLAWRAKRVGLDPDTIISMVFWMFVPGIVGARLFYVVEYWPEFDRPTFGETIGAVLSFSEGGLVVYGSLIGGMLGMVLFLRKHRLPMLAVCDLLAPSLLLGLALGRLGCLAHGCCFGGPSDLPWAVTFPPGSPVYGQQLSRGQLWGFAVDGDPAAEPIVTWVAADSPAGRAGLQPGQTIFRVNNEVVQSAGNVSWLLQESAAAQKPIRLETKDGLHAEISTSPMPAHSRPVQPTQVYGALNGLVLCLFLLAYAPFRRRDGEVFALMLTIYPITRFLQEIIRTDEGGSLGTGLTISQNISVLILLAVIALWVYILRQPRGTALPSP
ncbi:MAG TPA: prolipoprotein diacylglyceryl transferase family protein [Thermoguttaceae bacterium]|nr:prolipoprotein diacylglyceryl transferase family protein [Thermoguttaceae bacterium]